MDITVRQDLLDVLYENKIIKSLYNFDYHDQAIISLTKTLISLGYSDSDILDILLFHYDLLQNKQYECCCLINQIKKMINEIKEDENGIYN